MVAGGHPATVQAGAEILERGGNAYDAILAAHFAACVAEPVLTSLGGGGFLLAHTAAGADVLYDFFVETPMRCRNLHDVDFRPIHADFGTVQQEFHIGRGAIATPGIVKGLFEVHRDLASLSMPALVAPAVRLAREGITLNALQAYIFDVVRPIYLATPEARRTYGSTTGDRLPAAGERLCQPAVAETLERLAEEGDELFYRGAIAERIVALCAQGGHLTGEDLEGYQVHKRTPLQLRYRGAQVLTNPPPSSGGTLIGFALGLLEATEVAALGFGSAAHLELLATVMALTGAARLEHAVGTESAAAGLLRLLEPEALARYREQVRGRRSARRGTTHVSVMDGIGNIASLSVSNGEGCGDLVPGTGIMLNNMLGEEDLNPQGFHRWALRERLTSMMAPSIVLCPDGTAVAIGSGGSNRLRTAILQVLVNLIDFGLPLAEAVDAPRLHVESEQLNVEGGFEPTALCSLLALYPRHRVWEGRNLFFGGTHTVERSAAGFSGAGDPRRGGVAQVVNF